MNNLTLGPELVTAAQDLQDENVELRRAIHADPEIGLHLPATQSKILEALTGLGLKITQGQSSTSVVADLETNKSGPTVLLRADMDALPLREDNDIVYRSRHEDRMHACGHDSHVSMLVTAARILAANKEELTGRIRFMFQPGEEGFHGACHMIDEGVLEDVDRAFALHVLSTLPSGQFFSKPGPVMASADSFHLTIRGKGGHASMPSSAVDPIPAAAQIVLGLHTMTGRVRDASDPAVLTVGHLDAGTVNNVIPETALIEGTIRTVSDDTRALLQDRMKTVATHTSLAHGCTCETKVKPGYPVTVNDPNEVDRAAAVSRTVFGEDSFVTLEKVLMGAEDWSYVLDQVPGSMALLGVCPPDVPLDLAAPNHSNYMVIDEEALAKGAAMYAAMALSN